MVIYILYSVRLAHCLFPFNWSYFKKLFFAHARCRSRLHFRLVAVNWSSRFIVKHLIVLWYPDAAVIYDI
jgi:hypothetical protein